MRFGPPVTLARDGNGPNPTSQVLGDGPVDLALLFDRPGNGMSDRGPTGHLFEDTAVAAFAAAAPTAG
jgi:hypothetical protein